MITHIHNNDYMNYYDLNGQLDTSLLRARHNFELNLQARIHREFRDAPIIKWTLEHIELCNDAMLVVHTSVGDCEIYDEDLVQCAVALYEKIIPINDDRTHHEYRN